jgi:hypothetical protein
MRYWLSKHPVLYTFGVVVVAAAAAFAVISYCLSSWLILPLI